MKTWYMIETTFQSSEKITDFLKNTAKANDYLHGKHTIVSLYQMLALVLGDIFER